MFVLKKKKKSKRQLDCRKSGNPPACCFRTDRIIMTELSTAGRPDYKDFIKLPAAISHIIPQSAGNMQQLSLRYECIFSALLPSLFNVYMRFSAIIHALLVLCAGFKNRKKG